MRIHEVQDREGRAAAFEVSNAFLGRQGSLWVVRRVPGVTVTRSPRRWAVSEPDDFCEFDVGGVRFVVSEPFGDNSRYWVGPKPLRWVPEIDVVRETFAAAHVLFGLELGWLRPVEVDAGTSLDRGLLVASRALAIAGFVGLLVGGLGNHGMPTVLTSLAMLLFGAVLEWIRMG